MKKRIIITLILFFVIILRIGYKIYVFEFKYDTFKNVTAQVEIRQIYKITDEAVTYLVKYDKNNFLLYVKDIENIYDIGTTLNVSISNYGVTLNNNPYEFNYKSYLNSKNIVGSLYLNRVISVDEKKNYIFSFIGNMRKYISDTLDENLDSTVSNLLKSIMYGDDTYLDADLKEMFVNVGLGHVLCVSGTHIISLICIFENVIESKKKSKYNILLLIYFFIISLFNVTLIRPIVMYILSYSKKKLSFLKKIIITVIILELINPYYIFNTSILLSFSSVIGIKLFYTFFKSFFASKIEILKRSRKAKKKRKKELKSKFKEKIIDEILSSVSLTLSSQILAIPFELYFFGKITIFCIISNLFVFFILNVFMKCIFLLFVFIFIPFLSKVLIIICSKIAIILIFEVELLNKLNYLNITTPRPNFFFFILYYMLIFLELYGKCVIIYFWNKRKVAKRIVRYLKIMCVIFMVAWYIYIMYFESYTIFFNVGQGNMALIHKGTTDIVIDMGSTEEGKAASILCNFLSAKNISDIDMVLITHMHTDHMNGVEEILENKINITTVCFTTQYEEVEECTNLKKVLKENNVGIMLVTQDDNIEISDIQIYVLTPPKYEYIEDDDMLNANSTVYLITKNNKNYLFMGDSTKSTEEYILDTYITNIKNKEIYEKLQNIYVYQVSHHGSKTSSSQKFLSKIVIQNAVISAKKSVYGHPADETLKTLDSLSIRYIITENVGAIVF